MQNILIALVLVLAAGCGRGGMSSADREKCAKVLSAGRQAVLLIDRQTQAGRLTIEQSNAAARFSRSTNFGADPDQKAEAERMKQLEALERAMASWQAALPEIERAILDLEAAIEADAPATADEAIDRLSAAIGKIVPKPANIAETPPGK